MPKNLLFLHDVISIYWIFKDLDSIMATQFGLLGHPLGHSFSKKFHNERFLRLGIDAVYENFDLANIDDLVQILENSKDLSGLNVTIPYKQEVMRFLDALDPLAERIGAVNVVRIERIAEDNFRYGSTKIKGLYLKGFNSDIIGFSDSIRPMLDESHKNALILGTGGASKAIKVALENMNIKPVFVSRTKAEGRLTYDELTKEIMEEFTVIVNCSPVGMFPKVDECPAIPYEYLSAHHVCFDAVYNPEVTLFMKKAKDMGANVKCGYEMLVGQAIASYEIWISK